MSLWLSIYPYLVIWQTLFSVSTVDCWNGYYGHEQNLQNSWDMICKGKMHSREIWPAELWISFLGEVGEDVAVDVEAAEEGKEEM